MEALINVADRLGIPCAVLIVMFYAIWKILTWLAKNVITPISQSHIALVEETKIATKTNSATLEKMTEVMTQNYAMLGHIVEQNSAVLILSKDTNTKVSAIVPANQTVIVNTKEVEHKP